MDKGVRVITDLGVGGQRGRVYSDMGSVGCLSATDYKDAPKVLVEEMDYKALDEQNMIVRNDGTIGTLTTDGSSPKHNNRVIETIKIKQATKKGYIEMENGGLVDLMYPNSLTRRGRVQQGGRISPTIASAEQTVFKLDAEIIPSEEYEYEIRYRIRKLTPRSCGRFMDVPEDVIDRMLAKESKTQCYRAFGNSIIVNCMVAIFGQMIEGKENVYKEINET